ncbi:DUF2397 family protein, partial [Microbispora hainanensis]
AGHLTELGAHGRVLDESETRVLLKLMTRALEGRTVVAGRLRRGSGANDAVMVRLVPCDTGSTVRTTQGLLHLPGFRVELAGRTPVAGSGMAGSEAAGSRAEGLEARGLEARGLEARALEAGGAR